MTKIVDLTGAADAVGFVHEVMLGHQTVQLPWGKLDSQISCRFIVPYRDACPHCHVRYSAAETSSRHWDDGPDRLTPADFARYHPEAVPYLTAELLLQGPFE